MSTTAAVSPTDQRVWPPDHYPKAPSRQDGNAQDLMPKGSRMFTAISGMDSFFESRPHPRPFAVQNAEVDAVADSPRPGNHVPTKNSFFFRSNAKNRIA